MLYSILKYHNQYSNNRLVLTTHSPYIINYLTLAIKANEILRKVKSQNVQNKVASIVPIDSTVQGSKVSLYELDEKSVAIRAIDRYKNLPSDENYLNNGLERFNNDFIELLQLESNAN